MSVFEYAWREVRAELHPVRKWHGTKKERGMKPGAIIGIVCVIAIAIGLYMIQSRHQDVIEAQELRLANFYAESHPVNVALREVFVPGIKARTEGRYEIVLYPDNALGAEVELTHGVSQGVIDMGIAGGILAGTYPELTTLELPFLFQDYAHVWRVLDSPTATLFEEKFAESNLKVLSWIGNGFRHFSNRVRPLHTLEDMQGIRMRMPQNPVYIDTANALGFTAVASPFSEVYTALQTNVFDGQDNPLATFWGSRFYEVQEHVAITSHIFSHGSVVINMDLWNGMTPEDQVIFREVSAAYAKRQRQLLEDSDAEYLARIREVGVEVTTPRHEDLFEATQPVRDDFAAKHDWAVDLIERIRAQAE